MKVLDNEELTVAQFVERGMFFDDVKTHIVYIERVCFLMWKNTYEWKLFIALEADELDASEIGDTNFVIKDADNMIIDDMNMLTQWKNDSSFKIIIDLNVSRNKVEIVAEVCTF